MSMINDSGKYIDFLRKLGRGVFKSGRKYQSAGALLGLVRSAFPYIFIGSLIAAFLFCSLISGLIASRLMETQRALADAVARRAPSPFVESASMNAPNSGIEFKAFGVLESNPASADIKVEEEAKPIDSFMLVGTLPAIGAWINVDNATSLVLKSQEFSGYILETVERGKVLFSRDGESYPIFLNLSGARVVVAATPPAAGRQQQAPPPTGSSAVSPAEFNGNDGTIAREFLNDLISNPLNEMRKVRIVPEESGMRIRS
ncbi:MAG: hypothetical protein LBQ19_06785, partial [Synergistaceae bacterium]|nr:hypothetical protein [Synergistaceae bacterium]